MASLSTPEQRVGDCGNVCCQHARDNRLSGSDYTLTEDEDESRTLGTSELGDRNEPFKVTPLPKLQLFIAIFIQVAEPVTCTVIYPLVNDLIRSIGVTHGDETKTGYYVGVVESIFYAAECLTVMHWGKASDIVGRKVVLLGGMAGLAFSMFGFGLSKKYWMLLVSRCAQGAFNGNVGVTKSVMAEITDSTNAPQAFAFLPVAWSVGSTLGPAIGGALANPADLWPKLFGTIQFFRTFPYFLPCFVAALVPIFAFLLALVALKETAPAVLRRRKQQNLRQSYDAKVEEEAGGASPSSRLLTSSETSSLNYGAINESSDSLPKRLTPTINPTASRPPSLQEFEDSHKAPSFRSVFIPRVLIPITNFAFLAFLDQCVLVLIPLIYSTPLELGGLGLSPSEIGTILGSWGVLNGIVQVLCFARVRRMLGHRLTYVIGIAGMGITFSIFPVLSALVRWNDGKVGLPAYLGVALQLGSYSFSYMSYACMFLYIAAAAPSRSSLGTTNGLAQLTASGVRAIAPTAASSLFSLSLALRGRTDALGFFGGYMVYIFLVVTTVAAVIYSSWLPKELAQRED